MVECAAYDGGGRYGARRLAACGTYVPCGRPDVDLHERDAGKLELLYGGVRSGRASSGGGNAARHRYDYRADDDQHDPAPCFVRSIRFVEPQESDVWRVADACAVNRTCHA